MATEPSRRRKPETRSSVEEQKWVPYRGPSPEAVDCQEDLKRALYNEEWSWKGRCAGCKQHYGGGLRDGRCECSRPKPVGNVELWSDKELVEMLGDLGAAGMVAYLGEIEWVCEPTSVQIAKHRQTKTLCPRCRAFDAWEFQRRNDLAKRAKVISKRISEGLSDPWDFTESHQQELEAEGERIDVPPGASDVFVSGRL